MARLQMGQNAAARLLTSYSTMTRVTPVISYLQYIGFALGFLLRALVLTYRRPSHGPPALALPPRCSGVPCVRGSRGLPR